MSQSTTSIDNNNNSNNNNNNNSNNNNNVSVNQNDHDELPESLSPSPFRKIEFHHAKKRFTAFPFNDAGGTGSFPLETINPTTTHVDHRRLAFECFFDLDNNFRITFIRIGAGLENLGNTCFLNSVLQCLTYTEPLAAYLQSGNHQITCQNVGFCALCAIQKHVSLVLQSSGECLEPWDLVLNLQYICQTFQVFRQEDAHEYMLNLLESMHKCCLPSEVPSQSPSAYKRSLVHNIFGGRLRSQVKCMQCNFGTNKFEPFLNLSLEILEADSLYKAFFDFTAKEQLDGGAKEYNCDKCKQKVKALKQLTIHKAPNVLTIHLKRFGSHIWGQKIDKIVHFPSTFNLKRFVTGPYDGELKYSLYGVLVHAGRSTHSGHYYCFVRTSSGLWYVLDDDEVIQVSERTVLEQKAYMLFYFRNEKNLPLKKLADVLQQKETTMNNVGQSSAFPFVSEEKTEKQKVVSEPDFVSSPELVNVPSVLYHMIKSNVFVGKGHDIVKAVKNDSASLGNVAIIPSTCDGPQKLGPVNDKKEALSATVIEHEEKRTWDDVCLPKLTPVSDQKEELSAMLIEHEEKRTWEDVCPQKLTPVSDQKEALSAILIEHEEKNTYEDLCPQKLSPGNDKTEALSATLTEHEEKRTCEDFSPQKLSTVYDQKETSSALFLENEEKDTCEDLSHQKRSPTNDENEALSVMLTEHEEKNTCEDLSSQKSSPTNDTKEALSASLTVLAEKVTCEDLSPQTLSPLHDKKEALSATLTELAEKVTCEDLSPQKLSPLHDKKEALSATLTELAEKVTCEDLSPQKLSPLHDKKEALSATLTELAEKVTCEDLSPQKLSPENDKKEALSATLTELAEKISCENLSPQKLSPENDKKEALSATLTELAEKISCENLSPQKLSPENDKKEALSVMLTEHEEKRTCEDRSPQKLSPLHDKKEALLAMLIEHEVKSTIEDLHDPTAEDVIPQEISPMSDKNDALLTTFIEHEEKNTHEDLSGSTAVMICDKPQTAPEVSARIANEDVDVTESCSANGSSQEAITPTQSSNLQKIETFLTDKKAVDQKRHKKINYNLKAKVAIMKFSSNILAGTLLNKRKKKKHKGKKNSKNSHVKDMESGSKMADGNVNRIENELKQTEMLTTFVERNHYDVLRRSPSQVSNCTNCSIHSLQGSVPSWEETSSETHDVKENDQGKRKKATEFDGRNGFQDERLSCKRKKVWKKRSKQTKIRKQTIQD